MSKAIFITGAGAGIGAATAQLFLNKGWRVGLYDLDVSAIQAVAAQYPQDQVLTGWLDVTQPDAWQEALAGFFAWAGRLDVLLNNAGILFSGPFEQTPLAQHAKTLSVNVQGVMNGCHSALPYLKQTKGACVINLSSASAIYGQAELASYSSSKFAVRGLTEALNIEWHKYGIRVMDIMPLFVQTGMVTDMNASSIKRMGVNLTASDVANTVYKAATASPALALVHWPVGLPAKLMFTLSRLSPQLLNEKVNQWLTRG